MFGGRCAVRRLWWLVCCQAFLGECLVVVGVLSSVYGGAGVLSGVFGARCAVGRVHDVARSVWW